jgi:hypothetical protein
MTKYVARVTEVLRSGIHKMATLKGNEEITLVDLPLPNRVEIELESGRDSPCMMYRYTNADEFCGDTWHENLEAAFAVAKLEYGLIEADFTEVEGTV